MGAAPVSTELPPGFTIDAPASGGGGLPPGFTVDADRELTTEQQAEADKAKAALNASDENRKDGGLLDKALAFTAGGANGLVPIVNGAANAGANLLHGGPASIADAYRQGRDDAKAHIAESEKKAGAGYGIAGSIATSLPAAGAGLAGRLAISTGLGAVNAAADSDADTLGGVAGDTLKGAGIGLLAGGVGEAVGAGINKVAGKLGARAAEAVETQATADKAAVSDSVDSLTKDLKTARGEEAAAERAAGGEHGRDLALAPGENVPANPLLESVAKKADTVESLEKSLAAKQLGADKEAAAATKAYFDTPIFKSEVLPKIRAMAPQFFKAGVVGAAGEGVDKVTDTHLGTMAAGAIISHGVFGAAGAKLMVKEILNSPRMKVAIAAKMVPLLTVAARAAGAGITPTVRELAEHTLTEQSLGDPDLAAEKLTARGGLKSILGTAAPDPAQQAGLTAPQTPLDRAIQQTGSITMLASALSDHDEQLDAHIAKILKGEREPHHVADNALASQDFGAKRMRQQEAVDGHQTRHAEAANLAASPEAIIDRVANNTGDLSTVAPNITGGMTRVGQRAAAYLAKVGAPPPTPGPMSPKLVPNKADQYAFAAALEVTQDPDVILKHAAAGTLTPERMAALKAVYPAYAQQIQDVALSKMAENPKGVPYRSKLMLGMMTGIDPDGTLATTARNQAVIKGSSQKPSNTGAPSGSTAGKGADKLTLAQRTAPQGQSREVGKANE